MLPTIHRPPTTVHRPPTIVCHPLPRPILPRQRPHVIHQRPDLFRGQRARGTPGGAGGRHRRAFDADADPQVNVLRPAAAVENPLLETPRPDSLHRESEPTSQLRRLLRRFSLLPLVPVVVLQ